MEIKGKIIQILEATSGKSARGEWKRQDFILETQDQFPKKVCISNWNDKIDISNIENKVITASINIESREYNGKWYTDVKVWKMASDGATSNSSSMPSGSAPPPPLDVPPEMENSPEDDLPF